MKAKTSLVIKAVISAAIVNIVTYVLTIPITIILHPTYPSWIIILFLQPVLILYYRRLVDDKLFEMQMKGN